MRRFIFLWSERNEEHIAKHDVMPEEAEEVVEAARSPYPEYLGHEKWVVWGQTKAGRFLQVIFVYAIVGTITADEFARLELYAARHRCWGARCPYHSYAGPDA